MSCDTDAALLAHAAVAFGHTDLRLDGLNNVPTHTHTVGARTSVPEFVELWPSALVDGRGWLDAMTGLYGKEADKASAPYLDTSRQHRK